MSEQISLTTAELEELSRQYIDGELDRIEEKELELILLTTDVSTPVIDEVRRTMIIESSLAEMGRRDLKRQRRARIRRSAWLSAAASLVLILGIALWMLLLPASDTPSHMTLGNSNAPAAHSVDKQTMAVACVDGKELEGDEARRFAEQSMNSNLQMINEVISNLDAKMAQDMSMVEEMTNSNTQHP